MRSKLTLALTTALATASLFTSLATTAYSEVRYSNAYTYVSQSEARRLFINDFKSQYPGVRITYTHCYYPTGAGMPVFICNGKGRL
ncbi:MULTISPECIES: hypothetical protein [Pseudoalteromonas]|uniref:Uncharacterized protein n=1 Tax=Pseudoalteromonas obscura TaxID=3048491 RepID=A0ABT7EKL8_9GAMM|nr:MULTISPECIES: hypothetical protein [Pseudoalteromonas]MBQ4837180.1 hypothetical protein [Pseudoalteromonas luteoviolacea]MDK2595594.1 hypothetical protein [Pseudoalteromonas sp. P94(2023)]